MAPSVPPPEFRFSGFLEIFPRRIVRTRVKAVVSGRPTVDLYATFSVLIALIFLTRPSTPVPLARTTNLGIMSADIGRHAVSASRMLARRPGMRPDSPNEGQCIDFATSPCSVPSL